MLNFIRQKKSSSAVNESRVYLSSYLPLMKYRAIIKSLRLLVYFIILQLEIHLFLQEIAFLILATLSFERIPVTLVVSFDAQDILLRTHPALIHTNH